MENKELNNENVQGTEQVPQDQTQAQEVAPQQTRRHVGSNFNGQEEVLYTLEEEKEGSPLVPFLLIGSLIVLIILLPLISKRIDFKIFDPDAQPVDPSVVKPEEELYEFNKSSVRAKIGTLEFTNFVKSKEHGEYLLSFTINNVGEKSYDFSKKYYIVMYDGKKVVYRALIHSYEGLGALSADTLSVKLTKTAYDNATKFKLEEIPTAGYPQQVKTSNVEGDYDILTCSYNNNTIKYYFLDGELHKIYDEHNESKENNPIYESNKALYKNYSDEYKKVNNLSSIFIETETDFRMINEMDLKDISAVTMSKLRTYRFFKYKEAIKIVSFEMEAQGYKCG